MHTDDPPHASLHSPTTLSRILSREAIRRYQSGDVEGNDQLFEGIFLLASHIAQRYDSCGCSNDEVTRACFYGFLESLRAIDADAEVVDILACSQPYVEERISQLRARSS